MQSSGSESDLKDYFKGLKKQTLGRSIELNIEGLSESSDFSEFKKPIVDKKISHVKQAKNATKKKAGSKSKKTKNAGSKVAAKTGIKAEPLRVVSKYQISDSDLSLSELLETHTAQRTVPRLNLDKATSHKKTGLAISLSEDDSSSFGKAGNRFFKKPIATKQSETKNELEDRTNEEDHKDQVLSSLELTSSRDMGSSARKSTLRGAHSPPSKKKVTIQENANPQSLEDNSFIEDLPPGRSWQRSSFMGMNIMSIDDLMQDTVSVEVPKETENGSKESGQRPESSASSLSEVVTAPTSSSRLRAAQWQQQHSHRGESQRLSHEKPATQEEKVSGVGIRSSSSTSSSSSRTKKSVSVPPTERTGRSSTRDLSRDYTMTFEDEEDNDKVIEVESANTQSSSDSSTSSKHNGRRKSSSSEEVVKKPQKSKSKRKQEKKYPQKKTMFQYSCDPQLDGVPLVPPSLGMNMVDPAPIARYVISPDALEGLTAYSPYMLLITNTMRMQIEMTKNMIETQKMLYESVKGSIQPSHTYTTLDETKEFIKSKRTKRLTMKEALKMVDREG